MPKQKGLLHMHMQWRYVTVNNNDLVRKTIKEFKPYYAVPDKEKYTINLNENYLNVFSIPSVKADLLEALDSFMPQKYPSAMADGLRKELADYLGVKFTNIMCGNGGDEMITYLLQTYLDPGDILLLHSPTFDMYELTAQTLDAKVIKIRDLPGFRRDREGLLEAVKKYQPKVTVICNPNNPTGDLLPVSYIREVLDAAEGVVFVDEAYMEFTQKESVLELLPAYPNLIILRTLSKAFGLAGMRCGYLIAQEGTIDNLAKIRAPYNLNGFTQLLGTIVVRHRAEIFQFRDAINAERTRLYGLLCQIPKITVYPSTTNFLLVEVREKREEIFEALRKKGILIKIYRNDPDLPDALRISVTTKEVDDILVSVFREVLG